jgi:hypothetical protein
MTAEEGVFDADEPEEEAESAKEELLECLLKLFVLEPPKSDRAGEFVIEWLGELDLLNCGVGSELYSSISFRTTIMDRCTRFRASRLET